MAALASPGPWPSSTAKNALYTALHKISLEMVRRNAYLCTAAFIERND
jgi:hypothetical protein